MVGAAQYQDDEIDWVLSAVVSKKKQSYIQANFKEKFGRSLNHNQIRYIKNKYGKDPKFNSPLVNTRAPRIATSPIPDALDEHNDVVEQGNETDFEGLNKAGPATAQVEDRQGEPKGQDTPVTQSKRSRSVHDAEDVVERLIQHTAKSQRLDTQPQGAASTLELVSAVVACEAPLQPWNAADSPLSVPHNTPPFSTPVVPLAVHPLYTAAYGGTPQSQPLPFHSASTGISWTPSMSLNGHSWSTGNSPVLTSGGHPSALIQPPVMEQYHPVSSQTPPTTQYPLRWPALPVSHLSPSTPTAHLRHQEQQQQHHQMLQQEHRVRCPDYISEAMYQPVPSFQEIPIEPASSMTEHSPLDEMGVGGEYKDLAQMAASSPYDFSLFSSVPLPMEFPFQNVRYTGLTAATSQAIRQSLLDHPDVHSPNAFAQQQHPHVAPQSNQEHLDFGASTLELIGMIRRPAFNTTATMPHPQTSYPVHHATPTFSPLVPHIQHQVHHDSTAPGPQIRHLHGAGTELASTIDPRLLMNHGHGRTGRDSMSPDLEPSLSPPTTVKHELEPPPTG